MNSVAGIIIEDRKILIAKRIAKGDMGERWEFPGGKVKDGEIDEQALVREYEEEFGVKIRVGAYIGGAKFECHGNRCDLRAYEAVLLGRDFVISDHTAWRWARIEEIDALIQKDVFVPSDALLTPFIKERL
ncbi:MAG: NUDIX domain-containing protein [Treponema sp.]|jgi:8-oxo-dGTP diphosphatase|nr:NUDIX domain-containing protein [Treponema sp.]